ncbi:MAG: small ribosomal subunit Rsm22 family protein [Chlamydiota bacterium]
MQLPEELIFIIEELVNTVDRKDLYASSEALSLRYREKASSEQTFIKTYEEALAYLCTRFPATFAANHSVFSEIQKGGLSGEITSILDIGAGSGAAFWAAKQVLEGLDSYTFLEKDPQLIKIGKTLINALSLSIKTPWILEDYTKTLPSSHYDLVVISYSLGEVNSELWENILTQVFDRFVKLLVILEPGTPVGYKKLMKMREILIRLGGNILAPCPHNKACPIQGSDWCHFSQRLPRTSLHRLVKSGSLGYEDEKFSYLVISKNLQPDKGERVLRQPLLRPGYIEWESCTSSEGLVHRKVLKRDKENFNKVKKLSWGSFYQDTPTN